jgi:hypothetical protein
MRIAAPGGACSVTMEEGRDRARNRRNRVESRTRLTLGGMATVAASVAVVCAVAMTTSAALADSPGATVGAPVRVPASTATAAASSDVPASEVGTPAPESTAAPQTPVTEPETVPAPEPEDVAVTIQTPDPGEVSAATEDRFVEAAEVTGAWDEAYAWAEERGWPQARIDAWIARLDSKLTEKRANDAGSFRLVEVSDADSRIEPAKAEKASGRDRSGSTSGSKREQSQVPPG